MLLGVRRSKFLRHWKRESVSPAASLGVTKPDQEAARRRVPRPV